MCFAFLCFGIRYEKFKSTFSREKQILLPLYVLNKSMQQVWGFFVGLFFFKSQEDLEEECVTHQLKSELGC